MTEVSAAGIQATRQHIGARVRVAREAAGLSRTQLAETSRLGYWSIVNIELGHRGLSQESAGRIAAAVGMEVATLVGPDILATGQLRHRGLPGSSQSVEYFWQRVDKHSPDACWLWTGTLSRNGYGTLAFRGQQISSHRLAYKLIVGPIPDGLELDHTCHDPEICQAGDACPHRRCCNPAHLEAVTQAVNKERRGRRRGSRSESRPRVPNPGLTANQRLGLYLWAARKKASLTQAAVGEMVGLSEAAVSNIESGRRGTTVARRASFVAALGLDLEDMLRFVNSDPAETFAADDAPRFLEPEGLFDLESA